MSNKRKCSSIDKLRKQNPFLEKRENYNVYYKICLSLFTISSRGKYHISSHLNSKKLKKAAALNLQSLTVLHVLAFKIFQKKFLKFAL